MKMNREQLMDWAADNALTEANCEGTPDEALISGWVNAMDMVDEGLIHTDEEFVNFAYSEFDNMGYTHGEIEISRYQNGFGVVICKGDTLIDPMDGEYRKVTKIVMHDDGATLEMEDGGCMGSEELTSYEYFA
jgi:hypothetical protein